jgi:hypothetical protein
MMSDVTRIVRGKQKKATTPRSISPLQCPV